MNKLFIDNEVGGNVQGDIDANSVKVKGRHTGSINV